MKITRAQLRQIIEAEVKLSDEEKEEIEKSKEKVIDDIARRSSGVDSKEVKDAYEKSKEKDLNEELKRLSYVSKEQGFTYGLDHVSKKDKASDDIIGHTWLTHVKRKDSALNEVGEVLWHSLKENGDINFYDVEWSNGTIETDIPAVLLEKVKDSDSIDELHEKHGVDMHEEGSDVSERKYKKKKTKNSKKKNSKKKKSKRNKHKLYPYFYGEDQFDSSYYEPGIEIDFGGGFDGGGGE